MELFPKMSRNEKWKYFLYKLVSFLWLKIAFENFHTSSIRFEILFFLFRRTFSQINSDFVVSFSLISFYPSNIFLKKPHYAKDFLAKPNCVFILKVDFLKYKEIQAYFSIVLRNLLLLFLKIYYSLT